MVRVLIAEELPMIRGALAALLGLEPDIHIVAEVGRQDLIAGAAISSCPQVVIMNTGGIRIAPELREKTPDVHLLVLSATTNPELLRQALAAQVSGFLLEEEPAAELAVAVRKIAAGGRVLSPKLAFRALNAGHAPLTAREQEVLRLLASGLEPSDIAGFLFLQVGTVRNYLTSIVSKLDARNRVDAIRIASQVGWL